MWLLVSAFFPPMWRCAHTGKRKLCWNISSYMDVDDRFLNLSGGLKRRIEVVIPWNGQKTGIVENLKWNYRWDTQLETWRELHCIMCVMDLGFHVRTLGWLVEFKLALQHLIGLVNLIKSIPFPIIVTYTFTLFLFHNL